MSSFLFNKNHLNSGKIKTAFVFSGIASEWQTMGLRLYEREAVFRSTLEQFDHYLKEYVDISVINEISQIREKNNLKKTDVANYCILAIEIALVDLLSSWGIVPDGVTGHSAGSAAAAYTAGILDLPDTIKIIHNYSLMICKLAGQGIMAHISTPVSSVENVIKELKLNLSVAAINSPNATVVVGKNDEIPKIVDYFEAKNIFSRILKTNVPFHSQLVEPYLQNFFNGIENIKVRDARLQTYSYLYGVLKTDNNYDALYWPRMIREPLLFSASIDKMINDGYAIFIEIGPHPTLSQFIHETAHARDLDNYSVLNVMRRDEDETEQLLQMVSKLVEIGYEVDLEKFSEQNRAKVLNYLQLSDKNQSSGDKSTDNKTSEYQNLNQEDQKKAVVKAITLAISSASGGLIEVSDNHDRGFFDMGIDSVTNIAMREHLERTLDLSLPATLVFDFPNVNKLTDYLIRQLNPTADTNLNRDAKSGKNRRNKAHSENESIAVIGMGCRLPGDVNNPEEFWDLLINGRNVVSDVPASRWKIEDYYDSDPGKPGKSITHRACFLSDEVLQKFDASFFNISPREAEILDPQQRILLEVCWETFERAGIPPKDLRGKNVGVYLGICNDDYKAFHLMAPGVDDINAYSASGSLPSSAGGRISYVFGLEGPNLSIDTACSSSSSALHLAVSALRSEECEMAIVAGSNVMISPNMFIGFSKLGALSPDGVCKTFDDSANGYGRGEGVVVLALKRLHDAQQNGDNIEALVMGTAVNQDGASSSFIAPNGIAQQDVIKKALKNADLTPRDVDYIEAHGTGTSLGDPIEIGALSEIYGRAHSKTDPLIVGSVKTNIGHLESTSGLAGVVKSILCMQHGYIPPHLHFSKPNHHIPWDTLAVKIPFEGLEWRKSKKPRLAGISSFGFSGTNSHIIIQEAPQTAKINTDVKLPALVLAISAKTQNSLRNLARQYSELLSQRTEIPAEDICYTAAVGRTDFKHRLAITGKSRSDLQDGLGDYLAGVDSPAAIHDRISGSKRPEIAFMFTGQGSQYYEMGAELYHSQPVFRESLDRCDKLFQPLISKSITSLLYSATETPFNVDQTEFTQPLLFSIEYSLAQLWLSWGIKPAVVSGHSIGEFPAAVLAGVMSLEDAVSLVAVRGGLMASAPGNGMMAFIAAEKADVSAIISGYEEYVSIAAVNAPGNCVISGDAERIEEILNQLASREIRHSKLKVSHAFHSPLMESILDEFRRKVSEIRLSPPTIRFLSCMTGDWIEDVIATPEYWVQQIRKPVLFADAIRKMDKDGFSVFLELGPNPTLSQLGRQCESNERSLFLESLRRKKSDWDTMTKSLAVLYSQGAEINWKNFYRGYAVSRAVLPTYPFDRKLHWKDFSGKPVVQYKQFPPFTGTKISSIALENTVVYESNYSYTQPDYLSEHKVFGTIINPATAFISLAIEAIRDHTGRLPESLENFEFMNPLLFDEKTERTVQVVLKELNALRYSAQVVSRETTGNEKGWLIHCFGEISLEPGNVKSRSVPLHKLMERLPSRIEMKDFYQTSIMLGYDYGPTFMCVDELYFDKDTSLAKLRNHYKTVNEKLVFIHPGLLDSIIHVLIVWSEKFRGSGENSENIFLPVSIDRVSLLVPELPDELWVYTSVHDKNHVIGGDFQVFNKTGDSLLEVRGLHMKQAKKSNLLRDIGQVTNDHVHNYHEIEWYEQNIPSTPVVTGESILIFSDRKGLGSKLAEILAGSGNSCIQVEVGNDYRRVNSNEYIADPCSGASFEALFKYLESQYFKPDKILYLWNLDLTFSDDYAASEMEQAVSGVLSGLIHIAQHTGKRKNLKMWLGTLNAQPVPDASALKNPLQAAIWGMGRVIGLEYPELFGGIVDMDDISLNENPLKFFEETCVAGNRNRALRGGGKRYLSRLRSVDILSKDRNGAGIKADSSYLITGGLGGLGLSVAERLLELKAGIVYLTSRKPPGQAQLDKINDMKAAGGDIRIINGDIVDDEFVTSLVEEISNSDSGLKGIFHAAGVLRDCPVAEMDYQQVSDVLRPKLNGLWNLHKHTRELKLDYFVAFSSAASVHGNENQANYAAANAALDALVHYRRRIGLAATSLNWGPWGETGMAGSNLKIRQQLASQGFTPLKTRVALDSMFEVLERDLDQVIVGETDWTQFLHSRLFVIENDFYKLVSKTEARGKSEATKIVKESEDIAQFRKLNKKERCDELLHHIGRLALKVLGLDENERLENDKTLLEQGFDSLTSVDLRDIIAKEFAIRLPVSFLFNYPSIMEIVDYLEQQVYQNEAETHEKQTRDSASDLEVDELDSLNSDDLEKLINFELGID